MVDLLVADPLTLAYHELRSPLGLIATAARTASEEKDTAQLRRQCDIIARAAERMLRTTERVLAFADSARPGPFVPFRPAEVVRDVVETFADLGLPVSLEISPAAHEVELEGVPTQLEALVQSLLGNAFDHGEEGEPVAIRLDYPRDELVLAISNAIPSSCRHRGLGVGAYLSRRLAEQMGGVLRVGPEGSHYRALLRLPLGSPHEIRT